MTDLIDRQADDLISRKWPIECVDEGWITFETEKDKNKFIHLVRDTAPSAEEVIHCKDCFYGYLRKGIINGYEDAWIECINPDGLNRDVSIDGYCSAGVRKWKRT